MKLKNKFFSKVIGSLLMGAALLAPVAADSFTVNFVNGQMVVQSAPDANGYIQTYSVPMEQVFVQSQPAQANMGFTCPAQAGAKTQANSDTDFFNQVPFPGTLTNVEPEPEVGTSVYAQEVLRLTNQERARYGLAPLSLHTALDMAAVSHSQEMLDLNYFSHTSPTMGRQGPSDRVAQAGANPRRIAENIFQASGYPMESSAKLAVDSWMESPGHRRNILDPNLTHIGIGLVEKNGTFAATQVFGGGL